MSGASALMLFAAGLGTRMRPLTDKVPKPLVRVAGKALIDHALDQIGSVDRIVVNLHYLPEQIRVHLSDRANIRFSAETESILDTGGGLRAALPLLESDPVFTLNTDAVWTGPRALDQLRRAWNPDRMDGLLLLVEPTRAVGHSGPGDFLMEADGRLARGPGLIYTGAGIVRTGGLADFADRAFSLNLLWNRMVGAGRLYGTLHCGGWCDVGRPESIPLAEHMLGDRRV